MAHDPQHRKTRSVGDTGFQMADLFRIDHNDDPFDFPSLTNRMRRWCSSPKAVWVVTFRSRRQKTKSSHNLLEPRRAPEETFPDAIN